MMKPKTSIYSNVASELLNLLKIMLLLVLRVTNVSLIVNL